MAPRDVVDLVECYNTGRDILWKIWSVPSLRSMFSLHIKVPLPVPPKDDHTVSACAEETSKLWNTAKSSSSNESCVKVTMSRV